MRIKVTLPALCLLATSLAASVAMASDAEGASSTAGSGADAARPHQRLQEVIVTAEKRVTVAQKTPVSITTLSGADLETKGETELGRALRNVPSLQIQGTPQGGEIYIRGVGANGDSNFVDPSVALSMDSVYTARSERLYAPLRHCPHRGPARPTGHSLRPQRRWRQCQHHQQRLGGFYYLWDNDGEVPGIGTTQNAQLADGTNVNLFTSYTAGAPATVSVAGYGQVSYAFTPWFTLIGGLRHTNDRKSNATLVVSNYIPGYDSGQLVSTSRWGAWTYNVEAELNPTSTSMLYAEIAKGYKAGGYDTTAVPPMSYGPETVLDYELGSKNRFLDDTLQVNASLYFYQYHDLQVQYNPAVSPLLPIPAAYVPSGASYNYFQQYIANGGNGVNKGGELEVKYRFTRYDQFDLSLSYTDAYYGHFAQVDLAGLSGEQMAATPRWTAMPSYSHSFLLSNGLLTIDLDSKLSSSYCCAAPRADLCGYRKWRTRRPARDVHVADGQRHRRPLLCHRPGVAAGVLHGGDEGGRGRYADLRALPPEAWAFLRDRAVRRSVAGRRRLHVRWRWARALPAGVD